MEWFELLFIVSFVVFLWSVILHGFNYDVGYVLFVMAVIMAGVSVTGQVWSWI